jgi:hypothetical protein
MLFSYPNVVSVNTNEVPVVFVVKEGLYSEPTFDLSDILTVKFSGKEQTPKIIRVGSIKSFIYNTHFSDFDKDGIPELLLFGFDKQEKVGKLHIMELMEQKIKHLLRSGTIVLVAK